MSFYLWMCERDEERRRLDRALDLRPLDDVVADAWAAWERAEEARRARVLAILDQPDEP